MSLLSSSVNRRLVLMACLFGSAPLLAQCEFAVTPLPLHSEKMTASDDGAYLLIHYYLGFIRYDVRSGEVLNLAPPDIPAPGYSYGQAEIDNDGDRIAYVGESLDGEPGVYLFIYDIPTQTLTTIVTMRYTTTPSFSGDGSRIFFYSSADFGENPDGSLEVFRVDATGDGLIQITNGPFTGGVGIEFIPVGVNLDGTRAAFDSRYLEGGGHHASYWQEGVGLIQLTPSGFDGAELNDAGNLVVFVTPIDLVPGQNPEGYHEVFLYNADNGVYTQLTKATRLPVELTPPDISGDGRLVTISSTGDYNNEFPGKLSAGLYLIDTQTGTICTVTGQVRREPFPRIDNRGGTIFYSDQDFNIFMARGGVGVPLLTDFGLIILICAMAAGALYFLRKRPRTVVG